MCFFQIILDIKFVGRTNRGHTGFFTYLPSAVRTLIVSREGFSHSFSSATVKSNFVQSATRPSEHPPVKRSCFILFYFILSLARLLSNVPKGYRQFAASLITSHARASCPHRLFIASLLQTFPHGSHARGESIHRLRHIFAHL